MRLMRLKWIGIVLIAMMFLMTNSVHAQSMGPGRVDIPLIAGQHIDAGWVVIHNSNGGLKIEVETLNE